jgi:hypothetical protein
MLHYLWPCWTQSKSHKNSSQKEEKTLLIFGQNCWKMKTAYSSTVEILKKCRVRPEEWGTQGPYRGLISTFHLGNILPLFCLLCWWIVRPDKNCERTNIHTTFSRAFLWYQKQRSRPHIWGGLQGGYILTNTCHNVSMMNLEFTSNLLSWSLKSRGGLDCLLVIKLSKQMPSFHLHY